MAAQVLSGSGNVTYTNTTGQNVRIVLNYVNVLTGAGDGTMSFQGVTVDLKAGTSYGKTLALRDNFGGGTGVNVQIISDDEYMARFVRNSSVDLY